MGKHLHIDPFAGVAGDMFLAACIDLGADLAAIEAALRPLPMSKPWRLTVGRTQRHAISANDLRVEVGGVVTDLSIAAARKQSAAKIHSHDHDHRHDHSHDHSHDHAHDHSGMGIGQAHHHPDHCGYRQIMGMIDQLRAPERARERARRIVTILGQAEASVHGVPIEVVHFHEVGAIDSIVDMLGAAVAMELLEVDSVSSGPLPIGRGFVMCDHGRMPLPAPATAMILRGVPSYGVEWRGETVTPTGAAIVAAVAQEFGDQPMMTIEKIGYGAGRRDPAEVPNLVRLMLGRRVELARPKA
jgi:hypothetical protein